MGYGDKMVNERTERTYKKFSKSIWVYDGVSGGLMHRLRTEKALTFTPLQTVIKDVIDNTKGKDLSVELTLMFLDLIDEYC